MIRRNLVTANTMNLHHFLTVAALLSLSACASVDFDYPKEPSNALNDTGETWLGRETSQELVGQPENYSGFHPLVDGVDAVVHTAATVAFEAGRIEAMHDNNLRGVETVVTAALEADVRSIAYT